MTKNPDRDAEILRRLQTKRPFEVAKDMELSYAVVGGVLRRERSRCSAGNETDEWTEVDALPDPPLTSMERLDALYAMMRDVLALRKRA